MQNCPRHVPHADLWRKISRMPTDAPVAGLAARTRRDIHINHVTNQPRPPRPSARKKSRHPKRPTTAPPTSMPIAGPRERPDMIAELANPRRLSAKWLPRILQ